MKKTLIILLVATLLVASISACTGNVKEWQKLFFDTPTTPSQVIATPAVPPGGVNWEITPEPKPKAYLYLPIVIRGEP